MAIKIGQASIDENGSIAGPKTGDQTGKEVKISTWYSFPWNQYIECLDDEMADKAATYMEQICADASFGYSQPKRWDCLAAIKNNGGNVSGASGDCDCSSLVLTCYILAGLPIGATGYTGNMKSILEATGKFKTYTDSTHVSSGQCAKRGGIYVNTTNHTVMALENGEKAGAPTEPLSTATLDKYTTEEFVKDIQICFGATVTGKADASTLSKTMTLSKTRNCIHAAVAPVQKRLASFGYTFPIWGIDGEFGDETKNVVMKYQEEKVYSKGHADVDGEISARLGTWKKLLEM